MNIDSTEERILLVHTFIANATNPLLGMVVPVAELIENKLVALTPDNFCRTMRVFITSHYDELEKLYPEQTLFKLRVFSNPKWDESSNCKYIATASMAEPVKPKDFFEVVSATLPDPNDRCVLLKRRPPLTRYIFINDDVHIYGPFRWKAGTAVDVIDLDFVDAPLPGATLNNSQIYQVNISVADKFIFRSNPLDPHKLLSNLDVIRNSTFFDYASDDEIIKYCFKLQSDTGARLVEKAKVDALITHTIKAQGRSTATSPFFKSRMERFPALIEQMREDQAVVQEAMQAAFATEQGKELLGKFVEQNGDRFLGALKKERQIEIDLELKKYDEDLQRAQQRLTEIDSEKRKANDELQELKKERIQQSQASVDNAVDTAIAASNQEYVKKIAALAEVEKQLAEGKALLKNVNDLHELEASSAYMRKYIKEISNEIVGLEDTKRVVQTEILKSSEQLRARLVEYKPYVDSINGSYIVKEGEGPVVAVKTFEFVSKESLVNRQRSVVQSICNQMAFRGRALADWEVANLLITTQQSFITVLAGLPGTGKTTLARLMAEVQGITPRLREVAVARGWTSQKDLIGYFNPLANRFQPSSTGLYEFLKALSEETDSNKALAYTLLDEANLSPIEHYWSAFMDMADKRKGALPLTQSVLSIPSCLRFVATINYDGTTEPLSQRLINRAPIVVVQEGAITHSQPVASTLEKSVLLPLSYEMMEELFGQASTIPEFTIEEDPFQRIKKTLTDPNIDLGRPITISQRKELAIRHYCDKGRAVMGEDNEFASFDTAVLQHILPLVNGTGVRFKARLELLKKDLDDWTLPRSSNYLDRMIRYGSQDLHSYDFFCW